MKNESTTVKKNLFKKIPMLSIAGLLLGAVGGYIYYVQVGCVSGTCAITSNPWLSTAWGGAFGYLLLGMFTGNKESTGKTDAQN
jgi:xanthine/uracil permease